MKFRQGPRLAIAIASSTIVLGSGIALGASNDPRGQEDGSSPDTATAPELVDKRTATSETFLLPSGAFRTRIYQAPINELDENGNWKPLDGAEQVGDGSGSSEDQFELSLPGRMGAGPVRLELGDQWVSSTLMGAASDPAQVDGSKASYDSANPGTTFHLERLSNGVKENIEIASPAEPHSFSFELDASNGLQPTLENDGSVLFRDQESRIFATIPAPIMFDSSDGEPKVSQDIHYELSQEEADIWKLTVVADEDWLAQKDLTWPAYLDPTLKVASPSLDCTIGGTAGSSGWGLCGSGGQKDLYARYRQSGGKDEWSRSLLKFDLSQLPLFSQNPYVMSSTLAVHSPTGAVNTSGVEIRRVPPHGMQWDQYANWLKYNKWLSWAAEGGDYTAEGAQILTADRGNQAGWWKFDATGVAQWWASNVINGFNNEGVLLKLLDEKAGCCSERSVIFNSSASVDSSLRPYLEITYYVAAPAASKLVSPIEGTETARRLKLKAKWEAAGVTGITFQYREGTSGPFQTIPTSLVQDAEGKEVTKWPVATEGKETEPFFFDAAHASSALRKKGGTIQVRALFESPSPSVAGYSVPVKAVVDRFIGGTRDAATSVGPGSLNLLTGNLSVQRSDVSIPGVTGGLEFSRTHNSRASGSEPTGVLGPGWKPGYAIEREGGAEWQKAWDAYGAGEGAYVVLTDLEGYEYAFERTGETSFLTPPEMTGWVLKRENSTELALTDPDGGRTVFLKSSSDFTYAPISVSIPGGSNNVARAVYQLVGGKLRLSRVIAPQPWVECTDSKRENDPRVPQPVPDLSVSRRMGRHFWPGRSSRKDHLLRSVRPELEFPVGCRRIHL